jgi:hypothetical protein
VNGRVLFEESQEGVSGLSLELVNLSTGDRYPTTTFHDRTFYVLGVGPGRYRVVVSGDDLNRLGLLAENVEFDVSARRDEALIEGIEVFLTRGQ